MSPPRVRSGIAFALTCLALLSVLPVISNARPGDFPALAFATYLSLWQSIFGLPLFLAGLRGPDRGLFGKTVPRPLRRRTLGLSVLTGILFGLATLLYVLGVERAGAASAAVAIQAYPLFAILWESLFLGRRKTPRELALTGLMLAALYYLGTGGSGRIDGLSPWFLASLGVPLLWSIAHVIIKEEFARSPITPAQVTFLRVALSALFLGAATLAVAPGTLAAALAPRHQAYAAAMGLVYYLELVFWFHAVRHIDVSFASSITTPWPAVTMVLAALLLAEPIAPYQVAAFAVVAACIWGLTLAGLRKAAAPVPAIPDRPRPGKTP